MPSRDWIGDTLRAARADVRAYLRTAASFTFRPYATARAFFDGTAEVMNPLGVLASAAVILAPVRQTAFALLGIPTANGLLAAALTSLGPFAHYMLLGVLTHAVLRPLGDGKPRLSDSVAMTLFVGGGPAALAEIVAWIVTVALSPLVRAGALLGVSLGVAFSVFCMTLATTLSAIHRSRWWHVVAAYALAFTTTGLFFGVVGPPGEYGMHWIITVAPPRLSLGW